MYGMSNQFMRTLWGSNITAQKFEVEGHVLDFSKVLKLLHFGFELSQFPFELQIPASELVDLE